MLQVKNIHKEYTTGEFTQIALKGVSLDFRENEFVSILGTSGSGKTTLLNIIGGLDQYDSGDMIINGVSTKNYQDRDWDTYRNHSIGFVFQSYNLITHQSILSNVELALTIGGVSKEERKQRAIESLEKVGLGEHVHKKPNQLSGGQMQRVAIARALINNPDILLADEPTGALDTETSIQIMKLLKEVAKEKLVVMVTHNSELAEEYSTRIIKIKDGSIISDTNEFFRESTVADANARAGVKKSKMSLKTSFALSLSNLSTKKRRTILTAFAGSIGIIGIALILSLSNGVNTYIDDLQKETMSAYPITISSETIDMGTVGPPDLTGNSENSGDSAESDGISANFNSLENSMNMTISNNLAPFKEYLDDENSEIATYLGEEGAQYTYDVSYSVYAYDIEGNFLNTDSDPAELLDGSSSFSMQGMGPSTMMSMLTGGTTSSGASNFTQLMGSNDGSLINESILQNYDLVAGNMPESYDEVILVVDGNNTLSAELLYQIGFITSDEYREYASLIDDGEESPSIEFDYDEMLSHEFKLLTNSDKYIVDENGNYQLVSEEQLVLHDDIMDKSLTLRISGIISPKEGTIDASIPTSFAFTSLLTDYIISNSNESTVIIAQEASPETNILTGTAFEVETDYEKIDTVTSYIQGMNVSEKADIYTLILYSSQGETDSAQGNESSSAAATGSVSDEMLASMLDSWLVNTPDSEILLGLYDDLLAGSYEENLINFGKVDYASPSSINIYTDSFEDKDGVVASIAAYNETASDDDVIQYTDYVESLTSSMTTMVDTISYVLIAFVAVSLVVSCIMVGIITHISVIERTKEIGVLRALGASKANISQVFNAETLIIGLCSGIIGIFSTILLNVPINAIVGTLLGTSDLNVSLPIVAGLILIVLSVIITVIGGLIPSRKAAEKDPVIALRSE